MQLRRNLILFSTILTGALLFCSPDSSGSESSRNSDPPEEMQFDHKFDDAARLMAGMAVRPESPLASWMKNQIWIEHAALLDKNWAAVELQRLSKMRKFAAEELRITEEADKSVLYPFSGPDFLHVNTFFPDVKSYTMIGLENTGTIPDFSKLDEANLRLLTSQTQVALRDIFRRSYFITMTMTSDLNRSKLDGTIPMMFIFLARTNNVILDVKYLAHAADGAVIDRPADSKDRPTGVHIRFMDAVKKIPRDLFYYRFDVSDENLAKKPAFVELLRSNDAKIVYVKSASYLMHYPNFSRMREIAMNRGEYILQDDTGIAFHFFEPRQWEFRLYGEYIQPIRDFSGVYQQDLNKAYKDGKPIPIPFQLGYHWYTQKNNLMLAVKRSDADTKPGQ